MKPRRTNKPRLNIIAMMPDFKSRNFNRVKVVGHGATREAVTEEALRNVQAEYGEFYTTAWRSVFIGNRFEVSLKFKGLTPDDIQAALNAYHQPATVAA